MSTKSTQSLNQGWEFQRKSDTKWLAANVPGCVHLDLIDHGVVFAGIDVIGGMLIEINITSPTGLQEMVCFDDQPYHEEIIISLE